MNLMTMIGTQIGFWVKQSNTSKFPTEKIYATKAYNANPNHPFVLSIYGDALIRNGEIESALRYLKMCKMEPIPAMDSNSDRPLKKLF